MRYAQINTDNICTVVSNLKGEVTAAHMIPIADDENPIGKKWENGAWADVVSPTVYKILTKLQAINVLMTQGGMTPAELVTAREDANLKFYWMVWEFAGTDDVNRDSPNTAAVLAALRDNGYITQGELDAIMANWPTE
jgi:hypothetical protein